MTRGEVLRPVVLEGGRGVEGVAEAHYEKLR